MSLPVSPVLVFYASFKNLFLDILKHLQMNQHVLDLFQQSKGQRRLLKGMKMKQDLPCAVDNCPSWVRGTRVRAEGKGEGVIRLFFLLGEV